MTTTDRNKEDFIQIIWGWEKGLQKKKYIVVGLPYYFTRQVQKNSNTYFIGQNTYFLISCNPS